MDDIVKTHRTEFTKKIAEYINKYYMPLLWDDDRLSLLENTIFHGLDKSQLVSSIIRINNNVFNFSSPSFHIALLPYAKQHAIKEIKLNKYQMKVKDHFAFRLHCKGPYMITPREIFIFDPNDCLFIDLCNDDIESFTYQIYENYVEFTNE